MQNFKRWDDYLIAEHELIERSMAVLQNCLEDIELSEDINKVQMGRALDFLLQFGDKVHNKKEEEILFPRMGDRGVPVEGGPLGVMLMEHEAERVLLGKMAAALPDIETMDLEARLQFKAEGMDYLKVRAEHIWKENDVLYPMGIKLFSPADNDHILTEFDRINHELYGEGAFAKFQAMTEEVEQGGSGARKLIENLSYKELDAVMEALPFEVTFVNADDAVSYFNRLDKEKIFPRTRSVIGRQVAKCHPAHSVETVKKIVSGFKDKTLDKAEFWIDFRDDKVLIRYFPVYGDEGEYLGVVEVTQEIGAIQKLKGQKRLLDE
ncbi:hypothetical protein MNBD_DELTA03-640 [hydrothermal vent metagenome]|uniref:Hemerythrin-like domain-containing protein n=1 Tax=hydrothermal vent metagenome TaxID=652676 RepID=A0A3B0VYC1_9ZZZZ